MNDACAFVLAGGQSSRMAQDKAFMQFQGLTLLERALATVREVIPEARVVGSKEKFETFAPTVEDQFRGSGPLAGIHSALSASAHEHNLIVAVDMPFLDAGFLRYLLQEATLSQAIVTAPREERGWQPLCAVYTRAFRPLAESALQAGRNRIDPLFSEIAVRAIDEREMHQHGFSPEIFRNLNTREEFERAVLIKKM